MAQTTFKTNPVALEELLMDCGSGKLQLPDFQRSWVWVAGHGIVGAEAPRAEGEEVPDDIARDAEPTLMAAE